MKVQLIEMIGDNVILETEYGKQIWSAVFARKGCECFLCGKFKFYGAVLFRPTNPKPNQAKQRICLNCIFELWTQNAKEKSNVSTQ